MKITKEYLKKVIKEELEKTLSEDSSMEGNEQDFYENSGVVRGHIENIISYLVNPASQGGNFRTSSGDNILYQKIKGGPDSIIFTYSNGRKRATIDKRSLLNKFGLMNDFVAASKQYKAENPSQ
jgi:hypothetical protein